MLVCTDYRLEYKVDSIEDPQNREGRKAKGKRRKKINKKKGKITNFINKCVCHTHENIET